MLVMSSYLRAVRPAGNSNAGCSSPQQQRPLGYVALQAYTSPLLLCHCCSAFQQTDPHFAATLHYPGWLSFGFFFCFGFVFMYLFLKNT